MNYKSFSAMIMVMSFFTVATVRAQLPAGSFGITAAFAGPGGLVDNDMDVLNALFGSTQAQALYAVNSNFQIDVGVGYNKIGMESHSDDPMDPNDQPDPISLLKFSGGGKYFFINNSVSPFIGAEITYGTGPNQDDVSSPGSSRKIETSSLGYNLNFGGQYFLAKNAAIFGSFGFGYSQFTQTETRTYIDPYTDIQESGTEKEILTNLGFTGSYLGFSFYF